jgi:hypothetical protein
MSVSGVYFKFSRRFYELKFWRYEGKNHDGDGKNSRLNDSMEVIEERHWGWGLLHCPRGGFADHTEGFCQNEQKSSDLTVRHMLTSGFASFSGQFSRRIYRGGPCQSTTIFLPV